MQKEKETAAVDIKDEVKTEEQATVKPEKVLLNSRNLLKKIKLYI